MKSFSRYLLLPFALSALQPAFATEADAREVFSVAAAGGMTFMGSRVVDDISVSFLLFTSQGRSTLIDELSRTGVVNEAVNKSGALRADFPASAVQARRRVGSDGLDEYDVSGEMTLLWSKCVQRSCKIAAEPRKVKATGTVIQVTANGRPAYRVNTIRYEGVR